MDAMETEGTDSVLGTRKSGEVDAQAPAKLQKVEEDGGVAAAVPDQPSATAEAEEKAESDSEGDLERKFEQERAVGIEEFLYDRAKGFSGEMKKRYEDFLVSEVAPDGTVVHLTDQTPPDLGAMGREAATKAAGVDVAKATGDEAEVQLRKHLEDLLGAEEAGRLAAFVEETAKLPMREKKAASLTLAASGDKQHRTQVHKAIKVLWAQTEGAATRTDDSGAVVVTLGKKGRDTRGGRGPKGQWSSELPAYVEFVLLKENKDTTRVVSDLSRRLGRKPNVFAYAGTKDRRGVTTQRMTAHKVTPQELLRQTAQDRQLFVGNFKLRDTPLKLGQLYGNRFGIVVRDVVADHPSTIAAAMHNCKERGFINYYGMQRFGTGSTRTHTVGIALLKDSYEDAVKLILNPGDSSRPGHAALQKYADTGDAGAALGLLPRYGMNIEHTLLTGLKRHGARDFNNAFMMLPRNLRMLYVHAHQAYLWNSLASERIRMFGQKVVAGDLVLAAPAEQEGDEELELQEKPKAKPVHMVTEEEVENYSIFDVVIPLPGEGVIFPGNGLEQVFERLLEKDGLTRAMYGAQKKYNNYGDYRKIIERPLDLTWRIESYEDENVPVLASDKHALLGLDAPVPEKGAKTSVVVELTLHKSTYATMCLREILKQPTHWNQ
mmetsp:Transcript_2075/g.7528  ORF Transcript_2075/g.7528 Transcript_2075/m.7528 type:complete len:661 (+) Transcript_2075:1-1983(+)